MTAKRVFDMSASLVGLVIGAPILALIGLGVRLSSPGPVVFRQTRVGLGGRDFVLLKFRTMTTRAGSEQGSFDAGNSARVTSVGRWLRATKLDELPQLWNVVRGDMSLVGPRPEVRPWVRVYPERWELVHTVRPGITDPAAIVFRSEEKILDQSPDPEATYREIILPRKLALYEQYVRTRSFGGDLKILLRTVIAVILPARQADEKLTKDVQREPSGNQPDPAGSAEVSTARAQGPHSTAGGDS